MTTVAVQLEFTQFGGVTGRVFSVWAPLEDGEPDAYFPITTPSEARDEAVELMSLMGSQVSWDEWTEQLSDRGPWPDLWDTLQVEDASDVQQVYEQIVSRYRR